MRILFCDIEWMEKYNGSEESDETEGNFHKIKYSPEAYNFCEYEGKYYGYASTKSMVKDNQIHIEEFRGVNENEYEANNVFVIWTAKEPNTKEDYIIGFYKDATVFRYYCFDEHNNPINIECEKQNAMLIDTNKRIKLPKLNGKSIYLNNNPIKKTFIMNSNKENEYLEEILKYMRSLK